MQSAYVTQPFSITVLCDADRKSTTRSAIFLRPNLISWWSYKQHVITRSSTKAEYRSLAQSLADIIWIQALLKELYISSSTPVMVSGNQSVVVIVNNPVFQSKTKYMEIDVFCVRDQVLSKQLEVYHIPSLDKWADILTKPCSSNRFELLRHKLDV